VVSAKFFRSERVRHWERSYETRINALLRAYKDAHRRAA